jgi:hypothetical protein
MHQQEGVSFLVVEHVRQNNVKETVYLPWSSVCNLFTDPGLWSGRQRMSEWTKEETVDVRDGIQQPMNHFAS